MVKKNGKCGLVRKSGRNVVPCRYDRVGYLHKGLMRVEYKGKWYLFHHDSVPSGGKNHLRSLKVCELEYDAEGRIKTIEGMD